MSECYEAVALRQFAEGLMLGAGFPKPAAACVAEILVEGDLMGHTTHGLQMLSPYLKSVESGGLSVSGEPEILSDAGATMLWDGRYLPGPWVAVRAIEEAIQRIPEQGLVSVNITRCHHLACLQAYLLRATEKGYAMLLMCSDPSVSTVAPFGGLKPLYTPNPLAAGFPTHEDPILIDISMSITTNGNTMRSHAQGDRLAGAWIQSAQGQATDDPGELFADPPGSLLPLGGQEYGHKGFALGLLVECLTSALAGAGRSEKPEKWGSAVFMQIIDPGRFGGEEAFLRETTWLSEACRANPVPEGRDKVRMPGERGLKRRRERLKRGIPLYPGILKGLKKWADRYQVALPKPL